MTWRMRQVGGVGAGVGAAVCVVGVGMGVESRPDADCCSTFGILAIRDWACVWAGGGDIGVMGSTASEINGGGLASVAVAVTVVLAYSGKVGVEIGTESRLEKGRDGGLHGFSSLTRFAVGDLGRVEAATLFGRRRFGGRGKTSGWGVALGDLVRCELKAGCIAVA